MLIMTVMVLKAIPTHIHIADFTSPSLPAAPMVRGHLPKHGESIGSGATQTQMLVLELMSPFSEPPELLLSFTIGAQAYKYTVPLPLTMTNFLSPIVLGQPHYSVRSW
jgi:hypothetical protein